MTPDLGSIFSYLFISLVLVSGVREQRLSFTIYLACCCWLKTVLLLCRGKCRKHVYILILFFRETSHIWKVLTAQFYRKNQPHSICTFSSSYAWLCPGFTKRAHKSLAISSLLPPPRQLLALLQMCRNHFHSSLITAIPHSPAYFICKQDLGWFY